MKNLKFVAFTIVALLFTVTNVYAKEVGSVEELSDCVATDGNTCTLNANINVGEFTGAKFTIEKGKTITIDLNGYTISGKNSDEKVSTSIITNKGTLIINDSSSAKTGKIEMTDTEVRLYSWSYGMFAVQNVGTLTINGGSLINNGKTDVAYAVDNNSTSNDVKLIVNNGTLKGIAAVRAFANSTKFTNDIIINDGHLEGTSTGIWLQQSNANANKASLTVNGGTIIGVGYPGVYADINNDNGSEVISMTFNGGEIRNNSEKYGAITFFPRTGSSLANATVNLKITNALVVNEYANSSALYFDSTDEFNVDNIIISGGKYSSEINSKYVSAPYIVKEQNDMYVVALDSEEIIADSTIVDTEEVVEEVTVGVADSDKEVVNNVLLESLENNKNLVSEATKPEDIEVKLEIEKDTVSEQSKELIEESKEVENLTIVEFFDASVNVYVEDNLVGKIEELTKNVKITVMLPKDLQEVKKGYNRLFYLVREHDGKIEPLEAKLSEDGKSITAETNKFSTYAIAYEDVLLPPKTGDGIVTYFIMTMVSLIAMVCVALVNKKRFN